MTDAVQNWILRQKGFTTLINEKLANRGGAIGAIFTKLKVGKREYGQHVFPKFARFTNWFFMLSYHMANTSRANFSRYIGVTHGPLNYTGMFSWFVMTGCIIARFRFNRSRDVLMFNQQDQPEFWYHKYQMIFPPNALHNRLSAHYIEINHIFTVEMMKKYRKVRQDVILDRENHSQKDRMTKYICNPNYIFEPLGEDAPELKQAKLDGTF